MPKNDTIKVLAFIKNHCANCGNPDADREFKARLVGPVKLCKACHITECAVEVDLTLGGAERLTNDVQAKARTAARAFALACDGDFHKASLAEVIKTARSYAGAAQRVGHPWTLRNAMAAARTAITNAETSRTPMDQARPAAKKEAARVLVTAALHHMRHGAATDPQTTAHTLPRPNTPPVPRKSAHGAHSTPGGTAPSPSPATGKGGKPGKQAKQGKKKAPTPQPRNWRNKGTQPVTVEEAEAEALKVMAAKDPKASPMLRPMFDNADASRCIQTVWPSYWVGPAIEGHSGYVGHDCLLTSSMATGDNTPAPSDADPGSMPLLSVLPTAYHRQNQACVDYAVELAVREGAGESEAGDFARYFIRQSHEIVNLEYEWAWEQWQNQQPKAKVPSAPAPVLDGTPVDPGTLTKGDPVLVRDHAYDTFTSTWTAQTPFVGTYRKTDRHGHLVIAEPDHDTTCAYKPQFVFPAPAKVPGLKNVSVSDALGGIKAAIGAPTGAGRTAPEPAASEVPDIDTEAVARGMKLVDKAIALINRNRLTGKPGDGWMVEESVEGYQGSPVYRGPKGKARLSYSDDGNAYDVRVYDGQDKELWAAQWKGLVVALTNAQKMADEGVPAATPGPKGGAQRQPRVTIRPHGDGVWTAHVEGERYHVALEEHRYVARWAVVAPDNTRIGAFDLAHDIDRNQPPSPLVKACILTHRQGIGRKHGLTLTQTSSYHWDVTVDGDEHRSYSIRHDNRGRPVSNLPSGIDWNIHHISGSGEDIKVSTIADGKRHLGLEGACELIAAHRAEQAEDQAGVEEQGTEPQRHGQERSDQAKPKKVKGKKAKKGKAGKA